MTDQEKMALLSNRLVQLENNEKENNGVCRRIRREIRNLKKQEK